MGKLTGKAAVVTGASKGIGAAIARALAAEGASVAVNYATSREGADRVVAAIEGEGGRAVAVGGDVSKSGDVERIFAEAEAAFGRLDVLVNNAGVFDFQPLEGVTEEEYRRQFDINVLGTLLATRRAVASFGEGGGVVINVGSTVTRNPPANTAIYAATKGAVDALTLALARELGPRNVRVNALSPGAVETEGVHRLGLIGSPMQKAIVDGTPLGRMGRPDDVAKVAVFLASDDSAWLTGERLAAAGGWR